MNEVAFVLENFSVDFDDTLSDSPKKELDFKFLKVEEGVIEGRECLEETVGRKAPRE
jgi:hypothetical protein